MACSFITPFFDNWAVGGTTTEIYTSEGGINSNIVEVGQGNLKLHYSAEEGKLTRYVNSRNLVWYASDALISLCSQVGFLCHSFMRDINECCV